MRLSLSEGSKFCAIRRMRTSFGRGAKLAQQDRRRMRREERLRGRKPHGVPSTTLRYARDDKRELTQELAPLDDGAEAHIPIGGFAGERITRGKVQRA